MKTLAYSVNFFAALAFATLVFFPQVLERYGPIAWMACIMGSCMIYLFGELIHAYYTKPTSSYSAHAKWYNIRALTYTLILCMVCLLILFIIWIKL